MATDIAANVIKGEEIQIEVDGDYVIGRVNSDPKFHEGDVGFSVWTDRQYGYWVRVAESHPVRRDIEPIR